MFSGDTKMDFVAKIKISEIASGCMGNQLSNLIRFPGYRRHSLETVFSAILPKPSLQ
jgi:hypothetical protein